VEDEITVKPDPENKNKCRVNQKIKLVFQKSIILEATIVNKTLVDFQAEIDNSISEIHKRKILESKNNSE